MAGVHNADSGFQQAAHTVLPGHHLSLHAAVPAGADGIGALEPDAAAVEAVALLLQGLLQANALSQSLGQQAAVDAVHAGVLAVEYAAVLQAGQRPGIPPVQQHRLGDHDHLALQGVEKSRQLLHRVAAAAGDKLGAGGEAGRRPGLVVGVADHEKPLHSGGPERLRQPQGRGIEEELLQHQGRAVALPWQEYDRSSRVHVEITSKTWISCNQIIAKQD